MTSSTWPQRLRLGRAGALRRRGRTLVDRVTHEAVVRTQRPRARLAPIVKIMSPLAMALVLVVLACVAGGVLLGWAELWAGAVCAVLLLVLAVPFIVGGHRAEADLHIDRSRVVVGERAHGSLQITSLAAAPLLPMIVELPVGSGLASFHIPALRKGGQHEENFAIPTNRRAVLDLGPVRAVRSDPFALLRRDRLLTEPDLLYVHPRTVPIGSAATGFVRDLEGLTVRKISDNDVSFHAIRDYVQGDDQRFIHWKTTARTGRLMIRQFEETRRAHLLVMLSTRLDEYADDEEFELAVSVAGSLGAQNLRDGFMLSATSSTKRLPVPHPTGYLDGLAGVEYDAVAPPFATAARRQLRSVHGASVAAFVIGSSADPSALRSARRCLPSDVRAIAVQCQPGVDLSRSLMGDLDVVRLGALDELPGVIRRLSR